MLTGHGARIKGERVLLPPDLVGKCVAQCPNAVKVQGRDPAKAVVLGDGGCHAHNVGGTPNILDAVTGERRAAVRDDNVKTARLLDALPNVSALTPFFTPQDVPAACMSLWMYYDTHRQHHQARARAGCANRARSASRRRDGAHRRPGRNT